MEKLSELQMLTICMPDGTKNKIRFAFKLKPHEEARKSHVD